MHKKLEIVSYQRDAATKKYLATIRFSNDLNKSEKITLDIDRSLLFQAEELQKHILDAGGPLLFNIENELKILLDDTSVPISHIVHQSGWHDDDFVTPYGDFPAKRFATSENYSLNKIDFFHKGRMQKGDIKSFIKGLQKPLKYCSALRLVIMASLAPIVADRLGYKGHTLLTLTGPSSREKSLLLRTVMAAYSRATIEDMPSPFTSHWHNQKHHPLFGGLCLPFDCQINGDQTSNKNRKSPHSLIKALYPKNNQLKYSIQMLGTDATDYNPPLSLGSLQQNALRHINLDISNLDVLSTTKHEVKNNEIFDKIESTITNNYGLLLRDWVKIIQSETQENLSKIAHLCKELLLSNVKEKFDANRINTDDLNSYAEFFTAMYISAVYFNLKINHKFDYIEQAKEILKLVIDNINLKYSTTSFSTEKIYKALHENANELPKFKTGEVANKNSCGDGFLRDENGTTYAYFSSDRLNKIIKNQNHLTKNILLHLSKRGMLNKPKNGYTVHVQQSGIGRHRYYKFNFDKLSSAQNK